MRLFCLKDRNPKPHGCPVALQCQPAASLLVPVANYMQQSSGTWDRVFLIAAGANILASLLAVVVLKPWRKAVVAKSLAS